MKIRIMHFLSTLEETRLSPKKVCIETALLQYQPTKSNSLQYNLMACICNMPQQTVCIAESFCMSVVTIHQLQRYKSINRNVYRII